MTEAINAILEGSGAFYLTMVSIIVVLALVFMCGRWSKMTIKTNTNSPECNSLAMVLSEHTVGPARSPDMKALADKIEAWSPSSKNPLVFIARERRLIVAALRTPPQPVGNPLGSVSREATAQEIAMALCVVDGHDPDDEAPLREMCDGDNMPVPWWMVYVEYSEALLDKFSITQRSDAILSLPAEGGALIAVEVIDHDGTERIEMVSATAHLSAPDPVRTALADRFEADAKRGCYTLIKYEHDTIIAALRAAPQPADVAGVADALEKYAVNCDVDGMHVEGQTLRTAAAALRSSAPVEKRLEAYDALAGVVGIGSRT